VSTSGSLNFSPGSEIADCTAPKRSTSAYWVCCTMKIEL
jgi:hypothetical protein